MKQKQYFDSMDLSNLFSAPKFNNEVYICTLYIMLEEGIPPEKAINFAIKAGRKAADGAETII